jgi:HAD superfamily hydrolase (TIGR01509 family)
MSRKIEAVIFDMDGVLIDAKDWHYEALNRALALFGMEISRYDHLVTYDGLPTKKKLEMLSLERGLPSELHGFLNDLKQKFTLELIATRCRPTFVHQYALAKLRRQGVRLAVCSNSVRATIELMMRRASLHQYLECCLSAEDVTRPKPDPDIYVKVMDQMRLNPAQCLIVEDNPKGIAAAKASGAAVLEVQSVNDVTFENIYREISRCENGVTC